MPGFNAMAGNVRWALEVDKAMPLWDSCFACIMLGSLRRNSDVRRAGGGK